MQGQSSSTNGSSYRQTFGMAMLSHQTQPSCTLFRTEPIDWFHWLGWSIPHGVQTSFYCNLLIKACPNKRIVLYCTFLYELSLGHYNQTPCCMLETTRILNGRSDGINMAWYNAKEVSGVRRSVSVQCALDLRYALAEFPTASPSRTRLCMSLGPRTCCL